MIDLVKLMIRMDRQDPRINPVPIDAKITPLEILKRRKNSVELLLSILDDDEYNPFRWKGAQIVQILDERINNLS